MDNSRKMKPLEREYKKEVEGEDFKRSKGLSSVLAYNDLKTKSQQPYTADF